MTARDELFHFIVNLTPEQAAKIIAHFDRVKAALESEANVA